MAYIKNKRLFVPTEDASSYEQLLTVSGQEFLTADQSSALTHEAYHQAIVSPASYRVTRVLLLNPDETIRTDVSEFLVSGNLSMTQQSGIRKSGSMALFNQNGMFSPNVVNGILWEGTKLRIDTGICFHGHVFWNNFGICSVVV